MASPRAEGSREDKMPACRTCLPLVLTMILVPSLQAGGSPSLHSANREARRAEHAGGLYLEALEAPGAVGGATRPISLASGDFDGDGVPDLIVGLEDGRGGSLALYRGVREAIFPGSGPRGVDPFFPPIDLGSLPVVPDVLASGDFDNDGRLDLVAAAGGGRSLQLISVEGTSATPGPRIDLPGPLTALAVGEVNKADGLQDIVAAVDGPAGPELLVFESPRGALRADPETIPMPMRLQQIVLADVDADRIGDIAGVG